MRIAIIGAGPTGLVTLKYALDARHECDAFEVTECLGGTWVYTDQFGTKENGFPSYRSAYKGLRTNQPKELMSILDFPYPSHIEESFISQPQVLQYLNDLATSFNLKKHIQYLKYVTKVEPKFDSKWLVTVMDVKTKVEITKFYDCVFICTGHFYYKNIPKTVGENLFKGLQMHSRDYRTPDQFQNKRVLLIGGGVSAIDIAGELATVCATVCISHWSPIQVNMRKITTKPAISQLNEDGAKFQDGSVQDFDVIIYCTGYIYTFPFLTKECAITVTDYSVGPLYKHIINIEHQTMYFIGIPTNAATVPTADVQARFALAALAGTFKLPSKNEMLKELLDYLRNRKENNIPQRHTYNLGIEQASYFTDLAKTAGIRSIPPVISRIHSELVKNKGKLAGVKRYILVDDNDYIKC